MKYVIELKKDGRVRGEMLRETEEEAQEICREWIARGFGNAAEWHKEEKLWIALYRDGALVEIVDDGVFERVKGLSCKHNESEFEWTQVRDGKFYETLHEAIHADLARLGI